MSSLKKKSNDKHARGLTLYWDKFKCGLEERFDIKTLIALIMVTDCCVYIAIHNLFRKWGGVLLFAISQWQAAVCQVDSLTVCTQTWSVSSMCERHHKACQRRQIWTQEVNYDLICLEQSSHTASLFIWSCVVSFFLEYFIYSFHFLNSQNKRQYTQIFAMTLWNMQVTCNHTWQGHTKQSEILCCFWCSSAGRTADPPDVRRGPADTPNLWIMIWSWPAAVRLIQALKPSHKGTCARHFWTECLEKQLVALLYLTQICQLSVWALWFKNKRDQMCWI